MATQPHPSKSRSRRYPGDTFSLLSVGAIALLLLLLIALLLPDATISALAAKAAAVAGARSLALALGDGSVVTTTVTATVDAGAAPETPLDQIPTEAECTGCMHVWITDRYDRDGIGGGWRMAVSFPNGSSKAFRVPAGGDFTIPVLDPPPGICGGRYTISLEVPEGWEAITPASVPVTLSGTEGTGNCAQVRFKAGLLPTLKVVSLDQAGPRGKPAGLPDWRMTVADSTGHTLESTTDGLGEVYFALPHLGQWLVTEENKIGWQPADPPVPIQLVEVAAPSDPTATPWIVEVSFVNRQVHDGCIELLTVDPAGEPLDGWSVTVSRDDGTYQERVAKTGTDGPGRALVCGLPMGDYTVTEAAQAWYRADPKIGPSQPAVLTTPGTTVSASFVNEPLGCIDGYKIDYLDRGLAGWEVYLTSDLTGDRYATLTNALGYFRFPDLPFGPYTIEEVVKDGWSEVTAPSQQVNILQAGPECVPVRFKNIRDSACLEVYKGDAADANPESPIGYSGLAGVKITLQPAYGGTPVEMVTDGTGRAVFDDLVPGMYIAEETVSEPWQAVGASKIGPFELGASEPCFPLGSSEPVVFLNRQETAQPEQPAPAPTKQTPPLAPKSSRCRAWYTVRTGNTLYSIARWYGSTVKVLARANNIRNAHLIYVGQRLCIP